MHIAIIGAGIVGLATAWHLARDGHAITLLDREAEAGRGASFANGAQLSYSYVAPMASPDVLAHMPAYLLNPNSPIRFHPRLDPGQWAWALRFLAACTHGAALAGTAKLLALSFHSRERLHDMAAETGIDFDHARNGKLVVQSTPASQRAAEAQMALQAKFGCHQHALTPAECIALEPGLDSIAGRLAGGILTPDEEVGDCRKLCEGLAAVLRAAGHRLLFGAEARLARESGRIAGIDTPSGRIEADLYILAAGTGSRTLAHEAGFGVPVQPIRGYSISPTVRPGNRAPTRSITDTARKTVYAPLGNRLRVAGFAEIGGATPAPLESRAASLASELGRIFPGACDTADLQPWAGLRPASPTSVPVIGPSKLPNLLLNVGHGALGFTLAAGSAALLADLVAGRQPLVNPADYTI